MHSLNWTYAAIMFLAVATCAALLRRTQRQLPLTAQEKLGIGLGAFCGAMIGAKLPFLLSDWEGLLSGVAWLSDGKTIMFGIVGGYFGVELAKWILEIRAKTGDSFAVPVAISVAIGRVACFQAGCCYGRPTNLPWGVVFATAVDNPTVPRHPTQLYETAFHALAAAGLWWLQRHSLLRGQLIKLCLITYLLYRFGSEWLRPEPRVWGLTGYQWAALLLLPFFVWLWWRDGRYFCEAPQALPRIT
jgi:phosphatidylglycerol:prolipoprotein diacylglycerol transferase